jgi:hypothetical protein
VRLKKKNMQVNLINFLKTGHFNKIKLGLHFDELIKMIGKSDCIAPISRKNRKIGLIKYGDIEFYFNKDQRLYMIFSDTFINPVGI